MWRTIGSIGVRGLLVLGAVVLQGYQIDFLPAPAIKLAGLFTLSALLLMLFWFSVEWFRSLGRAFAVVGKLVHRLHNRGPEYVLAGFRSPTIAAHWPALLPGDPRRAAAWPDHALRSARSRATRMAVHPSAQCDALCG